MNHVTDGKIMQDRVKIFGRKYRHKLLIHGLLSCTLSFHILALSWIFYNHFTCNFIHMIGFSLAFYASGSSMVGELTSYGNFPLSPLSV